MPIPRGSRTPGPPPRAGGPRGRGGRPDRPGAPCGLTRKAVANLPEGLAGAGAGFAAADAGIKAGDVAPAKKVEDDATVREVAVEDAARAGRDYIDRNGDRRGYCYCCGRVGFKLNAFGVLSRHGYTRPGIGYDLGGCYGSKLTPEATLAAAIKATKNLIAKIEGIIETPESLRAFVVSSFRREIKVESRYGKRLFRGSRLSERMRRNAARMLSALAGRSSEGRFEADQKVARTGEQAAAELAGERALLVRLEAIAASVA